MTTYTLEQLAPGSYDVLLDGTAMASLVRSVHRNGPGSEWYVELLNEVPPAKRPAPFTSQRHVFRSQSKALEWLGVVESGVDAAGDA